MDYVLVGLIFFFVCLLLLQINNYLFSVKEGIANKKKMKNTGLENDELDDGIESPQLDMGYTPTNGPGQTPNDQIASATKLSTQAAENSKYDDAAYEK